MDSTNIVTNRASTVIAFIVPLSMTFLLHREPAYPGSSRDGCIARRHSVSASQEELFQGSQNYTLLISFRLSRLAVTALNCGRILMKFCLCLHSQNFVEASCCWFSILIGSGVLWQMLIELGMIHTRLLPAVDLLRY